MRAARRARVARGVVAGAAAAGLGVVFAVAVWTERGRAAESTVLDASAFATDSGLLGVVGVSSLAVACLVVAGIGLVRRRGDLAVVAVAIVAATTLLGQVLKRLVLVRPDGIGEGLNSFPSGHMIAFASVAAAVLVVVPPRARLVLAPAASVLLSVVAIRLVHDGWHRPSDVVGSLLLVTAATAAATIWRAPGAVARPGTHRLLEVVHVLAAVVAALVALMLATGASDDATGARALLAATWGLVAVSLAWVASTSLLLRLDDGRPRRA